MYRRIPTVSVDNTVGRTVALKLIEDLKNNLSVFSKAFVSLEGIYTNEVFSTGIGRNVSLDKNTI